MIFEIHRIGQKFDIRLWIRPKIRTESTIAEEKEAATENGVFGT